MWNENPVVNLVIIYFICITKEIKPLDFVGFSVVGKNVSKRFETFMNIGEMGLHKRATPFARQCRAAPKQNGPEKDHPGERKVLLRLKPGQVGG